MTKATPASDQARGTWPSSTSPATRAMAGSRHIRVPKAEVVSRRRAYISKLNGMTGSSKANPKPARSRCGVRTPMTAGPDTAVDTRAATVMDTASPCRPATSSPTAWVSRI
jgi:hypothetical protein